jgi:flavodoxin
MNKILVAYYSQTGNTKKIAEAIYSSLPEPKTIMPTDKIQSVDEYELVFIGFPVHSHSLPIQVEKLLKSLPKAKKIALFCTHGSLSGGPLSRAAIEHAAVVAAQAKLISTFTCRGKVSPQALELLRRSPEHEAWADMAASALSHPHEGDIADARAFARWVLILSRDLRV